MSSILDTKPETLFSAMLKVLDEKKLVSEQEIREQMASTDSANPGQGARMVAKAWVDEAFHWLMLNNGTRAAEMMNISMSGMPPLGVVENTEDVHHLVVCTLCSCYPRAVLGYPPYWYKSASYRARAVRDPRGLLKDFDTVLPDHVKVNVVDSTADFRWMVLPRRPAGTEGWGEEQLASIVRLGDMIGVTVPSA